MKLSAALLLPGLALLAMYSAGADADIIVKILRTNDANDSPVDTSDDAPDAANEDGPGGAEAADNTDINPDDGPLGPTTPSGLTAGFAPASHFKAPHDCTRSGNYVKKWYYDAWEHGPWECYYKGTDTPWTMRNAYRAGGKEGVHWVYTDSGDASMCLTNWEYYTADGRTLKTTVAKTTTLGGSRPWCALPVYRSGGVEGKQWENCKCTARHLAALAAQANLTAV